MDTLEDHFAKQLESLVLDGAPKKKTPEHIWELAEKNWVDETKDALESIFDAKKKYPTYLTHISKNSALDRLT
ncbi:hypothetical protein Mmc1_2261 [Magnetococcus marinus MC-1]|uniref:Uncharacterized protein n=1 Tax=Magnetococcus marinus (strain ATCC BAA-1437 / JCM 17883 / MC-1) TaxID=156889 RepID=A0L9W9_MAGMM|nr:hypothetical protein [Magnetococcus marinus]ABK44762.1 hypothetical protein Mmc1_2261 [Magnetococcus marinus MC-1]